MNLNIQNIIGKSVPLIIWSELFGQKVRRPSLGVLQVGIHSELSGPVSFLHLTGLYIFPIHQGLPNRLPGRPGQPL